MHDKEIDFVVLKNGFKTYIQVSDDISNEETFKREVSSLLFINDAYHKILISRIKHPEFFSWRNKNYWYCLVSFRFANLLKLLKCEMDFLNIIKGKKYFDYPNKYYYCDLGLRNSRLNYRQNDSGHIMENIIYNELVRLGYSVDVGVVVDRRNGSKKQKERLMISLCG